MFIVTAKVPRRRTLLLPVLAVLAGLCVAAALRGRGAEPKQEPLRAKTNAERLAFLSSLGWEAEEEPLEALRITLPDPLEEPYLSYNALQLKQGFDLSACRGETVERYTYRVTNHPAAPRGCQADLYVLRGEIVAGDIVCTGENGFIATLDYPEAEEERG